MDNFLQKFNKFLFIVIVVLLTFNNSALAKPKHYQHSPKHKTHSGQNKFASLSPDQAIANIINKYGNDNVGVLVASANDGKIIYARNANKLFMPASTLKTFTAAAALKYLGADYKFQTKVFAKNSNLYFYFAGDPTLTVNNLSALVGALKNLGINSINGDIYLDDTLFDQVGYGPGWLVDDRNFCYSAPVDAIALNRNCFPFSIYAPRYANGRVIGTTNNFYNFINVYSSAVGRYNTNECILHLQGLADNNYQISGCTKPNGHRMSFLVTAKNMRLLAADVLIKLLRQHNIQFYGRIKTGAVPSDAKQLLTHESLPLNALVKTMLKKSDNLYANSIYKKLGATLYRQPGTWQNGAQALNNILGPSSGIEFNKIRIVDGSGLSRENLITPHSLVALMYYVYHNPNIRESFIHSLGISGIDGHLQYRMESLGARVHAKTGTESGITSLAGYIYAKNGKVYTFAIMVNGLAGVRRYQALEDEICTYFARLNF